MAGARSESDLSLFELSTNVPEGFFYKRNFVSATEEQELIKQIQKLSLVSFKYYQFTGKRRTASFGWQYEFGRDEITRASDMPEFLMQLRERAGKLFEIDADSLVQASIVESRRSADRLASGHPAVWDHHWCIPWCRLPDETP